MISICPLFEAKKELPSLSWDGVENFQLDGPKKSLPSFAKLVSLDEARKIFSKKVGRYDKPTEDTLAWEDVRYKYVLAKYPKEELEALINKCNHIKQNAYKNSIAAQELINKLGGDKYRDLFLINLPLVGVLLERIVYPTEYTKKYYNKCLKVYEAGYWVCGYKDGKFLACEF